MGRRAGSAPARAARGPARRGRLRPACPRRRPSRPAVAGRHRRTTAAAARLRFSCPEAPGPGGRPVGRPSPCGRSRRRTVRRPPTRAFSSSRAQKAASCAWRRHAQPSRLGRAVSRMNLRWSTVLSRCVRPGWPKTKARSPSAAPLPQAQVVLGMQGLSVLVNAEEADVQVEAGVLEVVGVAAEEGDRLLRGEDQPHVGVTPGLVEVVAGAVVERDDPAVQAGAVLRLLLDGEDGLAAGGVRVGGGRAGADGGVDPVRHVLRRPQHLQFQVRALQLGLARGGVEAVLAQIAAGRAQVGQRAAADVVVGEDQAVARDERAGGAAEVDGGLLQVLQPAGRGVEVVVRP